jgi:hypothetical protein
MSDNLTQGVNKVQDFFNNGIAKMESAFQSSNYLDTIVSNGYQGVPYAAFGMVVIFLGVLTYATIADKDYGVGAAVESVGDSISSIKMPTMFSPSSDDKERTEIQQEQQDISEQEKKLESELKGGRRATKKRRKHTRLSKRKR